MRGGPSGVLAALTTAVVLFSLAGHQVTSATAGPRFLGRLGAALIEVDRWLPAHREDIDLLARDKPASVVQLRDLPVDVRLPAVSLIDADDAVLRRLIVAEMGRILYEDRTAAFRDESGQKGSLGIGEPVRWTVTLLGSGVHGFWQAALPISLLMLVAFVAAVMLGGRSPLPPLIVGAGIAALCSFGVWLLAQAGSGAFSSPVDKEIMLILRDGAWIGVRNGVAVAVIGVTLVFLSSLIARQRQEDAWRGKPTSPPPDAPTV